MDCELHSFLIVQENRRSNDTSCGSFAVESESIGMGNISIVQKVFLTILNIEEA